MKGIINIKQGQGINMYARANGGEVYAVLERGDVVEVLALQGSMAQVTWSGVTGWISKSYLTNNLQGMGGVWDTIKGWFSGSTASAAASVASIAKNVSTAVVTTHTVGQTLYVKASSLNLRQNPTTSAAKIASIPNSAAVTVVSGDSTAADGYKWVKVTYNGQTGYVASEYLSASPTTNVAVVTSPTKEETNSNSNNMITLSDTAKTWVKRVAIGVAVAGAAYGIYKVATKKPTSTPAAKEVTALNGCGKKRKRKHKKSKVKRIGLK